MKTIEQCFFFFRVVLLYYAVKILDGSHFCVCEEKTRCATIHFHVILFILLSKLLVILE